MINEKETNTGLDISFIFSNNILILIHIRVIFVSLASRLKSFSALSHFTIFFHL